MSETDRKPRTVEDVADLLRARPGLTCTEVGENLWAKRRASKRQAMARPAGVLLARAARLGLVESSWKVEKWLDKRGRLVTWHRKTWYAKNSGIANRGK